MSLEIRTPTGKLFGLTDCEDEFVVVNKKKIPLQDLYADDKLLQEFNDEVKNSDNEIQDVQQ